MKWFLASGFVVILLGFLVWRCLYAPYTTNTARHRKF
jgi:hypothetical protein